MVCIKQEFCVGNFLCKNRLSAKIVVHRKNLSVQAGTRFSLNNKASNPHMYIPCV